MNDTTYRLSHRMEADLRWYLHDAAGDMGLRSSHPAMVARLQVGGRTGGRPLTEINESCLDAATRERPIRRAFAAIALHHREVLVLSYGAVQVPRFPGFGRDAAPLVLLTRAAEEAHARSETKRSLPDWIARLSERVARQKGERLVEERAVVRAVRAEAEGMLARAAASFAGEVRRRPHRVVRAEGVGHG